MANHAEVHGNQINYVKPPGKRGTAATWIQGSATAKDYDVTVENRKTGAGVHVSGDTPVARAHLWSVQTTLRPEVYVNLQIQPWQESKWNARYQFYTLQR
jgi:hypothetical protein